MSLYEQPYTVLNSFSAITDSELESTDVIIRSGAQKLFCWWAEYVDRHDRLPTRNSFDILKMLPHAAHMFLAVRLPEGGWAYQLQGEEFKRLFNGGFQNNTLASVSFPAFGKSVPDYLDNVAGSRKCRRSYGILANSVQRKNAFESIDCPLTDSTGNVSHVIGIAELFRNTAA